MTEEALRHWQAANERRWKIERELLEACQSGDSATARLLQLKARHIRSESDEAFKRLKKALDPSESPAPGRH